MSMQTRKHRAELDAWVRQKVEKEGAEYCELIQCLIDFALDELAAGAPDAYRLALAYQTVFEDIGDRVTELVEANVALHESRRH